MVRRLPFGLLPASPPARRSPTPGPVCSECWSVPANSGRFGSVAALQSPGRTRADPARPRGAAPTRRCAQGWRRGSETGPFERAAAHVGGGGLSCRRFSWPHNAFSDMRADNVRPSAVVRTHTCTARASDLMHRGGDPATGSLRPTVAAIGEPAAEPGRGSRHRTDRGVSHQAGYIHRCSKGPFSHSARKIL